MEAEARCPCCGETLLLFVDEGGGENQSYIEDCQVCCRPLQVNARIEPEGRTRIRLRRLDE